MRLYYQFCAMLFRRFVLHQSTGRVICRFAERMGVVYIKMAQILAMQNIGQYFTEADREQLAKICDNSRPIAFTKIMRQIKAEYGGELPTQIREVLPEPIGSASISQVHKAILCDGTTVAIKVKRQDLTKKVQHDVRQLRRLIHRFGRLASMRNLLGSDKGLTLWADWIEQETDFRHERQNLEQYQEFAQNVNGHIPGRVKIVTPKLYSELCTANLLVMEFIDVPTVNQLELTPENKQKISRAENDYIALSFYALFHDLPVVFHGDPHGGNIYIDRAGNIGFLDFGLVFGLQPDEANLLRQLFLLSYVGDGSNVLEILLQHSHYEAFDRQALEQAVQAKANQFQSIPVPQFFVEMIGVFTQYNIEPPEILFKAAKAFLAIFGIGTFVENSTDTASLLASQVVEYYLRRTTNDVRGLVTTVARFVPNFIQGSLTGGLTQGLTTQVKEITAFRQQLDSALDHGREVLKFLEVSLPNVILES